MLAKENQVRSSDSFLDEAALLLESEDTSEASFEIILPLIEKILKAIDQNLTLAKHGFCTLKEVLVLLEKLYSKKLN
jgi:hypothetical protein